MAATALAWLAGLGQGAMGFPQGLDAAAKMQMEEQDRRLRERQVATGEAAQRSADEARFTELGSFYDALKIPRPAQTRVPTSIAGPMLTLAEKQQLNEQQRQGRSRVMEGLIGQQGPPSSSGVVAAGGAPSEAPEQSPAFPGLSKYRSLAESPEGWELLKGMLPQLTGAEQKITPVPRGSPGAFVGGKYQPIPRSASPDFTPPAGSRPIPTVTAQGEVSTRYEPPPWQHGLAERALADAGWRPEMPGYAGALFSAVTAMTPYTEGGGAVPRTFAIPSPPSGRGAPPPAPASPGPPGPTRLPGGGIQGPAKTQSLSAEQTVNLADFRTLLGQLKRIGDIYDPSFVGPVAGNVGRARTATGIGAGAEEATFRSELASIQNSIIYLKSGKQINEQEFVRLKRELPLATDPEVVFQAKLARAIRLTQEMLANRQAELAARGFRGGSPPSSGAPGDSSGRTFRIRDRNNPRRTGTITLAPGESLPEGLEVIQ